VSGFAPANHRAFFHLDKLRRRHFDMGSEIVWQLARKQVSEVNLTSNNDGKKHPSIYK